MPARDRLPALRLGALALITLFTFAACSGDQPTEPNITGVELAKGGNGGGGKGPKVNQTDPPEAPQDTTLDVLILGSGFDETAEVTFTLDGTVTDSVRTNSTAFENSRRLRANITIAADAIVDLYDVEVFLSGPGKKGIGANLFAVVEKGKPVDQTVSLTATVADAAAEGVSSDLMGDYVDGQENVLVILQSLSGNLSFDTEDDDQGAEIRALCLNFGGHEGAPVDGCRTRAAIRNAKVRNGAGDPIQGGLRGMPVGEPATAQGGLFWGGQESGASFQYKLAYGIDCEQNVVSGNRMTLSHPDADTWIVSGQTAILCAFQATGKRTGLPVNRGTLDMPFMITLTRNP